MDYIIHDCNGYQKFISWKSGIFHHAWMRMSPIMIATSVSDRDSRAEDWYSFARDNRAWTRTHRGPAKNIVRHQQASSALFDVRGRDACSISLLGPFKGADFMCFGTFGGPYLATLAIEYSLESGWRDLQNKASFIPEKSDSFQTCC